MSRTPNPFDLSNNIWIYFFLMCARGRARVCLCADLTSALPFLSFPGKSWNTVKVSTKTPWRPATDRRSTTDTEADLQAAPFYRVSSQPPPSPHQPRWSCICGPPLPPHLCRAEAFLTFICHFSCGLCVGGGRAAAVCVWGGAVLD